MKLYKILKGDMPTVRRHANDDRSLGVLITDDTTTPETVRTAWSYAVRYSAKGLDVRDYDGAITLMMSRHPSWQFEKIQIGEAWYDSQIAENDQPEG